MNIRRVLAIAFILAVAVVPLGCNQVNVGFARFQLINHTPYNITFYAVARSAQALYSAENRLTEPLGPNDSFDADVRFPGRFWLRAVADVNGTPVERTIGPETIRDGNKAWAWYMDGEEIKAGSGPRDLYAVTDLPAVVVNTDGQAIVDDPKVGGTMRIAYDSEGGLNRPGSDPADYDGFIGIEIRGNTSQTFPEESYGWETWDAEGEGIDASVLGLPLEEDWVLYGPCDETPNPLLGY